MIYIYIYIDTYLSSLFNVHSITQILPIPQLPLMASLGETGSAKNRSPSQGLRLTPTWYSAHTPGTASRVSKDWKQKEKHWVVKVG